MSFGLANYYGKSVYEKLQAHQLLSENADNKVYCRKNNLETHLTEYNMYLFPLLST